MDDVSSKSIAIFLIRFPEEKERKALGVAEMSNTSSGLIFLTSCSCTGSESVRVIDSTDADSQGSHD